MINGLIGVISGLVSGMGMGGGTILHMEYLLSNLYMMN